MIKGKPTSSRHFTSKHPLFRRSKKTNTGEKWQDSIYYLWWEFLRRHEGYRQTCERGGGGRFAKLYEDFGDVHRVDFKTWWNTKDRGAYLFAEPAVVSTVSVLTTSDISILKDGWHEESQLIIAVPLAFSKRAILIRLRAILKKHHGRKRGQRLMKESKALYLISAQFNFANLKKVLEVYDLRLKEPELRLWQIAQRLKFSSKLESNELNKRGSAGGTDRKAVMSVAASRKFSQAKRIIEGVGRGVFP